MAMVGLGATMCLLLEGGVGVRMSGGSGIKPVNTSQPPEQCHGSQLRYNPDIPAPTSGQ